MKIERNTIAGTSSSTHSQESVLALLEFNKLLVIISGYSHSEATKLAVQKIRPYNSREDIDARQRLLREIMRMSHEGKGLRLSHFPDITRTIAKARPQGAMLDAFELAGFMPVFDISSVIAEQIQEREDIPSLRELIVSLTGFPDIFQILKRSVSSEGDILDSASYLLSEIREKIRRLETKIGKKLEEMVRDERLSVFLQDDFITKRSGRWVIPVRMDSKGLVDGVVHDVSNSGETAFIEPLAIIHLANELENLVAEQKAEEIRILRHLSTIMRNSADGIEAEYQTLVHIDLLNCIAQFAISLDMEIPLINSSGSLSLIRAKHPLLLLAFRKTGQHKVVPLDVSLGGDNTVMVITGSNAGGKTIAIKTIGLLLLMALAGLPVPADAASGFPLIQGVLVDIGDEQSIENNLSTFSAHVGNISSILKNAGPHSLTLIDELGTGTDPDEGAALACAVLKELRDSGALVFTTTHLADIKGFVHRTGGMVNASMEFDIKTLTPLYRLRIGEPGQSHALETARRYGLPDSIIDTAKKMLGGIKSDFDNLIADLNSKRTEYERALSELGRNRTELEEKSRLSEERLAEMERVMKEKVARAYHEAADVVIETKRQMHAYLDELKKKDRATVRQAIKKVESVQHKISEKVREYDGDADGTVSADEISEGESVFVRSLGYDALVVKVMKKELRVKVRSGSLEIELPLSDISLKKGRTAAVKADSLTVDKPDEVPVSRINLVGMRVDEALSRLEPFLNHATLAGLSELTIIHGFGTGKLSRAVREHLAGHPLVKHFRGGERSEGGDGVTVATLH